VRANATIAVARRDGRDELIDRRSQAPFSVRRCGDRIMVASSAAMPVGGDELDLSITVDEGARAAIGSVAATMVWPGAHGERSAMSTVATIGAGGRLDLGLEPTVSVAGSWHRASTIVRLAGSATCCVVEEVVLGRTGECSGRLDLALRVERDGSPLAHHEESFGPGVPGAGSSVSVGGARHVLSAVLVGVDAGRSRVRVENGRAVAWLPVQDDAVVIMAVGPDRPTVLDLVGAIAPELCGARSMAIR
jgi:urease accessory protein